MSFVRRKMKLFIISTLGWLFTPDFSLSELLVVVIHTMDFSH